MSAGLLISSIILYILSLVISLVLMILSYKISNQWKIRIIAFHAVILVAYLLFSVVLKSTSGNLFLTFFCLGVSIAGMILRSNLNLFLKLYYAVFLCSIFIFLYSPSMLFSLLAKQSLPEKKGTEFLLAPNYYLIKEKSLLEISGTFIKYKIAKRTGKFNKTIQRNISFSHEIDSIKVLKFTEHIEITIRGYFLNKKKSADSADISSSLQMTDENEISIQRKNEDLK